MRYAEVTDMKRIFGGTLTLKNGRINNKPYTGDYNFVIKHYY